MTTRWAVGILAVAIAALAAATGAAWAAPAKRKVKPAPAAEADAQDDAALAASKGVDKKRFEFYLKERLKKIKEAHQVRVDFFAKEQSVWTSFWDKVRDEREQFEIRITRQTLDLFESLASLDPKDYPLTIANFEKLQTDVIKAFESQQKNKMTEFFASRDARWKEFAADQEKERSDFVADAEQSWEDNKKSLRDPENSVVVDSPQKPAKAAAADEGQDAPAEDAAAPAEPKPNPKPKAKPRAERPSVSPSQAEDQWH